MKRQSKLPPIVLGASEADRLSTLAMTVEARQPDVATYLLSEIERARVVADPKVPADSICIGRCARFLDEVTGQERQATLVYPADADLDAGRISILTPVGAALLGLRPGQRISWTTRTGETRHLKVLEVGTSTAQA